MAFIGVSIDRFDLNNAPLHCTASIFYCTLKNLKNRLLNRAHVFLWDYIVYYILRLNLLRINFNRPQFLMKTNVFRVESFKQNPFRKGIDIVANRHGVYYFFVLEILVKSNQD